MSIIVPLHSIKFENADPIKFEGNIEIYPLGGKLRSEMLTILPSDNVHEIYKKELSNETTYLCLYIESPESEYKEGFSKAHEFLSIMRITKYNPASLKLVFLADGIDRIKSYKEYWTDIYTFTGGIVNFDNGEIDNLKSFWNNFTQFVKGSKNRVFNALLFHELANSSYYWEYQIVNNTIVLECLFSTGNQEIAFQISTRLSWFLYPQYEQYSFRKHTFEQIKKIYRTRSKIVHGEVTNESNGNSEIQSQSVAICNYVHMTLRKILSDSDLIKIFLQKTQDLQEYFKSIILGKIGCAYE